MSEKEKPQPEQAAQQDKDTAQTAAPHEAQAVQQGEDTAQTATLHEAQAVQQSGDTAQTAAPHEVQVVPSGGDIAQTTAPHKAQIVQSEDTAQTAIPHEVQTAQQTQTAAPREVQATPPNHKPTISKTVRIANARQNQPYDVVLDEVVRQEWINLVLLDDAGTGLQVTADGHGLSGTPVNHGECRLRLRAQTADGAAVALTLELLINPDPKTLWHTIEPQSPLFRKPHQAYQRLDDARVCLTAARVRGRSHAHKGSFCEDDFAVLCDGDGAGYLGMVADGAGSSRFSRLASQVLCDSVPRHLHAEVCALRANGELDKLYALLDGTEPQQAQGLQHAGMILANAVKRGLSDIMAHTGLALRDERSKQYQALTMKDLYTTCLVFWALPLHDGRWLLVSYWVGDGGLAVEHSAGFTLLGTPDGGEFSGQTRFLAGEEISDAALNKRLRAAIYPDLRSVWALTDGITDAKFASEQQLERSDAWQALTDDITPALGSAEVLYDWLGFWSQGNHDDRSVCVLQVREVPA